MTDRSSHECDRDRCAQCATETCDHDCHADQEWNYLYGWLPFVDDPELCPPLDVAPSGVAAAARAAPLARPVAGRRRHPRRPRREHRR